MQVWLAVVLCFTVGILDQFGFCDAIVNSGNVFDGSAASYHNIPRFSTRGVTFKVTLGDDVVLPCQVQNLGSYVLIWRKGQSIVSADSLMVSRDPRLSLEGRNLKISLIQQDDQGDYTCQIGDGTYGDLIHTVEILTPPSITKNNSEIIARKGGSVTFQCEATGNPVPSIQWSKKDGKLPSGLEAEPGNVLTVNSVEKYDSGVYQCLAVNGVGSPAVAEVSLHVLYPPEAVISQSWKGYSTGFEVKIECIIHADPAPDVRWQKNSFPIMETDRFVTSRENVKHCLTIKTVQPADFGNYSCTAVNSIGKTRKFIEVSGKPRQIKIISKSFSGPKEHRLKWIVQSIYPIETVRLMLRELTQNATFHYPVQWHDTIIVPKEMKFISSSGERTQYYVVTNLRPDAVYEVMLQANNENGWGDLSEVHQWSTGKVGEMLISAAASHRRSIPSLLPAAVCLAAKLLATLSTAGV